MSALSVSGAGVAVSLIFTGEERLGAVLLRWVPAPTHLDVSCGCGAVDVLVVADERSGLWMAAAVCETPEHREAVLSELSEDEASVDEATARCSAAFGVPWEELSVAVMRGQLVLMAALEPRTIDVLRELDPGRLVEMRLVNVKPAQVVRALRAMRDYAAGTQ